MDHNIDRLRYAALELLLRLSRRIPRKRASTIFLVNNLHHIVQVPSSPPIHAEKALHANKQAKLLRQPALLWPAEMLCILCGCLSCVRRLLGRTG